MLTNSVVNLRNKVLKTLYKYTAKPMFFKVDPETIHDFMVGSGENLGKYNLAKKITTLLFNYQNSCLTQKIFGITFKNPIGLAAGFDKNAQLTQIIPEVGFGFEEIGSITAKASDGNPKPRLWRLPKSEALVVNYGLKNEGAEILSNKLASYRFKIPIGTSIAKTNCLDTVDDDIGIEDYVEGFKKFTKIGDYFTINISCPNTYGGQPFTDPKKLNKLFTKLDKIKTKKPIFIKFSPDLNKSQMDKIIKVCDNHRVHGMIISNLTKPRTNKKIKDDFVPEKGGISGKVVEQLSNDLLGYVYQKTKGRYILIGCGGVFTALDAYKKIKLGATLVQMITGMIYQGPQTISEINLGLVKLLKKDGFKNISEAVGKGI